MKGKASSSTDAAAYMARAIELAARGQYTTRPNPCVGCVLVNDEVVVAEAWHRIAGGPHAEASALETAGAAAQGATCYVSLEPCSHHGRTPPCADALIAANIARVAIAMEDPNPRVAGAGIARLRDAGISVELGLLADKAAALNRGFVQRMCVGRPLVRIKLGISLDGRTATASGESKWITSQEARADVQYWRGLSGAILTGIGTVLADDPALTVRDARLVGAAGQPLRVIIDSRLRIPPSARLLSEPGETLVMTVSHDSASTSKLVKAGANVARVTSDGDRVDLGAVLHELARREINDVLVEAGPSLVGALFEAKLVDELLLYIAPALLGDAARGVIRLPGLRALADAPRLEFKETRMFGPDIRVIAQLSQRPDNVGSAEAATERA